MRVMNFIDVAYLKLSSIEGDFDRIKYQRNKTEKFFSLKVSEHLKKNTHEVYKKRTGGKISFSLFIGNEVPESGYCERIRSRN
jgi:hypothetical protein